MPNKKIEIKFKGLNGNDYTFKSEINDLNGNWMWTFDNWIHCYAGNKNDVNGIVKSIKEVDPNLDITFK